MLLEPTVFPVASQVDDVSGGDEVSDDREIANSKLIDLFQGCLGALLGPWLTTRAAKATAEADRIRALSVERIRQDLAAIRAGRKSITPDYELVDVAPALETSATVAPTSGTAEDLKPLLLTAEAKRLSEDSEKILNLLEIAELAMSEDIEDPDDVESTPPPEPDWFTNWRKRAEDVTDAQMQSLWARLLKKETSKPG